MFGCVLNCWTYCNQTGCGGIRSWTLSIRQKYWLAIFMQKFMLWCTCTNIALLWCRSAYYDVHAEILAWYLDADVQSYRCLHIKTGLLSRCRWSYYRCPHRNIGLLSQCRCSYYGCPHRKIGLLSRCRSLHYYYTSVCFTFWEETGWKCRVMLYSFCNFLCPETQRPRQSPWTESAVSAAEPRRAAAHEGNREWTVHQWSPHLRHKRGWGWGGWRQRCLDRLTQASSVHWFQFYAEVCVWGVCVVCMCVFDRMYGGVEGSVFLFCHFSTSALASFVDAVHVTVNWGWCHLFFLLSL